MINKDKNDKHDKSKYITITNISMCFILSYISDNQFTLYILVNIFFDSIIEYYNNSIIENVNLKTIHYENICINCEIFHLIIQQNYFYLHNGHSK